jgi:hypothetical protein
MCERGARNQKLNAGLVQPVAGIENYRSGWGGVHVDSNASKPFSPLECRHRAAISSSS